jgi:cytochrome oxidase Cu insertion factor (SCO1/SenC/PrrC family)
MRRLLVLLAFLSFASGPAGAADRQADGAKRETPVAVGEPAPDFNLEDQDGRRHSLSAQRGKQPVVLVFYRGYW